ncbi:MAG: TonB-dependent receptor [Gammaproteobacteria bacterium]|nr:TonB-dependent receptor [Gammaproteobacteria bacterium]MDH3363912.1 TonB-dependent receptor [Gammaproteobacteria bacterium]
MSRVLPLLVLLMASAVFADDSRAVPYVGRTVANVIDGFRDQGHPFAYSTNLVSDELRVVAEPAPGTPVEIVRQILRPYGLDVQADGGVYLVVKATPDAAPLPDSAAAAPERAQPDIETVVVAASRYEISRDISTSQFALDRRTIQNMPDVGEDPIRVTQRLPGTAASGASAVAHFRGGEQSEIGIMLNGQWLFDPFHIRDYQNIFSAIDARAIEGVEVYTGGFPVRYGDRMSGLVLMDSLDSEKSRHTEIGLSVFNTSLLSAGTGSDRSWLFSARRGNLDLVIDPKFGQPSYFDVFGEYTFEITADTRLSLNALYADDQVKLVLETDPAEREQVVSDTSNAQFWLRLDSNWSPTLSSSTVLSMVQYSNSRDGYANDPEKLIAAVADSRDVRQYALRQDWVWSPSDRHRTQWGIHVAYGEADYAYAGSAAYFGLQEIYENQPAELSRSLTASPTGGSYALYVSDRWRLSRRAILEWGLRWDDQTYTDLNSDSQLSPRLNMMFRPREDTELRFSVGRYHQSQPVHSLQIEDGITNFWPAQRADHLIVGIKHLTANDTSLRLEAFRKDIRDVRPRFENLYDPLSLMPELAADRVRLDPPRAEARGVELSADRTMNAWSWWATYTWSTVTDRIDGRNVPRSWDQRHALQGGFAWDNEVWSFSAAASVHSGWPRTDLALVEEGRDADGEPIYVAVPGLRNELNHPTFASVDVRVSRKYKVRRGSLLAFIEISNLFNRRNVCCIDWDLDEDALGNAALEFSHDYWLPLLPAIGVLWEF